MQTDLAVKVGDTVRLKSGSTTMSVEAMRRDGRVICVWFDARDVLCRAAFAAGTLEAEDAERRRR